jgi:Ser/Thr protein kinase RdoA (MazF antagonist)
LRIQKPAQASLAAARSEALWLAALRQDSNLVVPEPVRNRNGELVTLLSSPSLSPPRHCVLFTWVAGRFLDRGLTENQLFRVGTLMGQLQNHAANWERPAGFTRHRVDNLNPARRDRNDGFDEAVAAEWVKRVTEAISPAAGAIVAETIRRAWIVMQTLGEGPEVFGLIHGDLHQWNYLFHRGAAGAIDFDDCGYGHWLYDLAVTLNCLRNRPRDHPAMRQALLAGYRQLRPLSVEHEGCLDTFVALRTLQDLLSGIGEAGAGAPGDQSTRASEGAIQALREIVGC